MNWTLFDGFMTRYTVEQAKVSQLSAQLAERDLHDDVVGGIAGGPGGEGFHPETHEAVLRMLTVFDPVEKVAKMTTQIAGLAQPDDATSGQGALAGHFGPRKRGRLVSNG